LSSSRRSPTTSQLEGSFLSHANYLRALATLAGYTTFPAVRPARALAAQRDAILASPSYQDVPQGPPDLAAVRRSLSNAWGTELLLSLSGTYASEDELARIANNWGAVQTYYVAYHAFQAYLVANGEARPDSHAKTQRMFASRWARSHQDLRPWSLASTEGGFLNGPPDRPIDLTVHQWKTCDASNCWDIAGRALHSTREDAIPVAMRTRRENKRKDRRLAWEREERERFDAGRRPRPEPRFPLPYLGESDKQDVRRRVRPYTPMDYLYRLRVKSNYEDSTMFTEGPTDETSSRAVHRDLVRLASSVMLLHELHVTRLLGRADMRRIVARWIDRSLPTADRDVGIALRRDLLVG
jgi:hypothetical protein